MTRFLKRYAEKALGKLNKFFCFYVEKRNRFFSRSLVRLKRARLTKVNEPGLYSDYIRLAILELCAFEIKAKNVPGSVAELGVYRGDFAKKINEAFPDRKLFLFDTFEGFDKQDIEFDKSRGYSDLKRGFWKTDTPTDVSFIKSIMKYPENCIIKKGYFPDTASGVKDSFVFVNIDVDLFKPIYEGLKFFWPRLEKGGYIFVHDFNNDDWRGVREAVNKFCLENGISYIPIPDAHGSVIIAK